MKILFLAGAALAATPALAQHDQHQGHGSPPPDHSAHQAQPAPDHTAHAAQDGHAMTGALGAYPMSREASGTAWQPDASRHGGIHVVAGDWTLMGHAALNLVYD